MTAIAEEISKEEKTEAVRPPGVSAATGIVDLDDGHGFLRTAGYRRSGGDIPITPAQVRRYALRPGDQIEGTAGSHQGKSGQDRARQDKAHQNSPCPSGQDPAHRRVRQRAPP